MFDLPVMRDDQRKGATRFRKLLLEFGFDMMQFSIYARYFSSVEASESCVNHIHNQLPKSGQVRLLTITDKQFSKMEVYQGKKQTKTETKPEQLLLF